MKKTLAITLALLIMGGPLSWADEVENGLRDAAARARDARDAAAAALNDARAARDAAQAIVDEALDRRDDAQLKLDASTSDEDRQRFQVMYEKAVADARAHRPQRNATIAAYRARVAEFRAADAALDDARAALDAYYAGSPSVGDLQAKIATLEAALKAAQDDLKGKGSQAEIARLEAALKDSENALKAARAIIAGMEAKIADLLSGPSVEELQARIAELEAALQGSGRELQAALKEVESSEVEINQLEAEIVSLSGRPTEQDLRAQIPGLVEALEASESNLQATLQEVESSRATIVDLDLQVRTLEGQLADAQARVNTGTTGLADSERGCAVFEMSDGTHTTHDPANGIWCVSLADMHGGACLSESVNTDLRFTIDSPSGTFAGTSIHFRSGALAYVNESTSTLVNAAGDPVPPRAAKLRPVLLDDHGYGVNTFVKPSGRGALQFGLGAGQFGAYDTGTGQFDKGGPGNQPDAPDALRDWFDNVNTVVTGGVVTRPPFCSPFTTLPGTTG